MSWCCSGRGLRSVVEQDGHWESFLWESFLWEGGELHSEGCLGVFQEQREERTFQAKEPAAAKMWIEKGHASLSG